MHNRELAQLRHDFVALAIETTNTVSTLAQI